MIWPSHLGGGALARSVLLLCVPLVASASEPSAPASAEAPAGADASWHATRRAVRRATEWLVEGVDGWFGDKPFSDGGEMTDGRISMGLLLRQNKQPDFNLRLDADLKLPNADRYVNLFLGRDNPRDLVTDKPDELTRRQLPQRDLAAERVFFAGVGVSFLDSFDFRLGFRGGLNPYAQVRYRQTWQLDKANTLDFRQTLFWSVDDLVGSTTALTYEHAFSPGLVARWLGAATITQRVSRFEWSNSFGLHQVMGPQRLLTLEALISGLQGSRVGVLDWGLQVKWEQPVVEDWLLGELTVGHFWPRPDALSDRGRAWALGGRVTMKF